MPGLPLLLAALGIVGLGFGLVAFVVVVLSSSFDTGADVLWIGGNLVIGAGLLVTAAALNFEGLRERLSTGEARRAGRYGSSAIASTLLSIAILVMLGFLATRYPQRFDWSEGGIHSLSDQTVKVLEGLEEDAQVLALVGPLERMQVEPLLDRYAYASERFRVELADPNQRPGLLEEYGISPDQLGPSGPGADPAGRGEHPGQRDRREPDHQRAGQADAHR